MWLCGRDPQRQCQTVDREDWGSGLYQLSFKNFDNFVCLFRGGKLKDPTHPEKKNMSRTHWGSGLYQLSFKNFDNFVCLFRGGKLKDPTHPEKKHVTDSLVISFSKLPLT